MERGLQELLSIFGLLIGPHVSVVVVAGSHVAACYGETGKTSREFNVWKMCFHLPIYALTLFHISQNEHKKRVMETQLLSYVNTGDTVFVYLLSIFNKH